MADDRSDPFRNQLAFLVAATTRLAINVLQSARARRETCIGPWLPEPVDTSTDPGLGAERGEALNCAVLLLLEKLLPTERAAYVLREAFSYPTGILQTSSGSRKPTRGSSSREREGTCRANGACPCIRKSSGVYSLRSLPPRGRAISRGSRVCSPRTSFPVRVPSRDSQEFFALSRSRCPTRS